MLRVYMNAGALNWRSIDDVTQKSHDSLRPHVHVLFSLLMLTAVDIIGPPLPTPDVLKWGARVSGVALLI